MALILWLFGISAGLEILIACLPLVWHLHKYLAFVALVLNSFIAGFFIIKPHMFGVLLGLLCFYKVFNDMRIIQGRMHEAYLRRAARRTAVALLGLQGLLAFIWWAWDTWRQDGHMVWAFITSGQLMAAGILLASTLRSLKHTAWPENARVHYSNEHLPTLTVAIPARNETEDLRFCLESLVASDYPKMEIIVLDDCSQTRRTPEIIRSFAHDGVRFVQGQEPKEAWLPKNQAYDRLAGEASGELILFCGVDIRFGPNTLRKIVSEMLAKNKSMISILPERAPMARNRPALAQAMRYFWELALPRRQLSRPPVLSSCWAITTKALNKAGGFAAVSRSIVPEAYFARSTAKYDGYSFMRAGKVLQLTSIKDARDQHDTAVRTRYPQMHRRPENVFVTSIFEVVCLVAPFVFAVTGYWLGTGVFAVAMAALASVLLIITYKSITTATFIDSGMFGVIALPIATLFDLGMLHYSMWRYEFSVVEWRGRNVTTPAMHVVPHLPKLG